MKHREDGSHSPATSKPRPTRVCPTPKLCFLSSFADADAEGGGGPSLAENNLDPKPALMEGSELSFPSFCPSYRGTPQAQPLAASETGAVLPARVI